MNTNATEHRYPASQRNGLEHIDLTRRLTSLKSSLTPDADSPAARLRMHPIPIPDDPPSAFLPAFLTVLLILAAITALIFAHFPAS